jgi:hypothetical protein
MFCRRFSLGLPPLPPPLTNFLNAKEEIWK